MRIFLAPILDFFLNCHSPSKKGCFCKKKIFDLFNIKEVRVASAHTQHISQQNFCARKVEIFFCKLSIWIPFPLSSFIKILLNIAFLNVSELVEEHFLGPK